MNTPVNMPVKEKIENLRGLMRQTGIDAYLIPRSDEYQNEFVAPYAERLRYISNFTGSAGIVLVTEDSAALFTDARYTDQAQSQCDADIFQTFDTAQTTLKSYITDKMGSENIIGFDPWLHTVKQIQDMSNAGIQLKPLQNNLIDAIWSDQPPKPDADIFSMPEAVAGRSAQQKLNIICKELSQSVVKYMILTACDSISWLLNERSNAVNYTPLVLKYGVVNVSEQTFKELNPPYDLSTLKKGTVGLDFSSAPTWFFDACKTSGITPTDIKDPCAMPKSIKTQSEQESIKRTHIQDGIAIVKFMHWLEQQESGTQTELDIVEHLNKFREQSPAYKGNSFPTIAGYGPNGAIIHYRPTPPTNAVIKDGSFLLLDSGGQYAHDDIWGTTDITRTIPIGGVTDAMKHHYTLVLQGMIALSMARVEQGAAGIDLDKIARTPLTNKGLNYAHGTGHGVGCYLAVHEEAANISPKSDKPMRGGMLVSNEPGYYKNGSHGIRIENLILAHEDNNAITFETITLAPICTSCIVPDVLTNEEVEWLNVYHKTVYETLLPHIDDQNVKTWLAKNTQSL